MTATSHVGRHVILVFSALVLASVDLYTTGGDWGRIDVMFYEKFRNGLGTFGALWNVQTFRMVSGFWCKIAHCVDTEVHNFKRGTLYCY